MFLLHNMFGSMKSFNHIITNIRIFSFSYSNECFHKCLPKFRCRSYRISTVSITLHALLRWLTWRWAWHCIAFATWYCWVWRLWFRCFNIATFTGQRQNCHSWQRAKRCSSDALSNAPRSVGEQTLPGRGPKCVTSSAYLHRWRTERHSVNCASDSIRPNWISTNAKWWYSAYSRGWFGALTNTP